MSHNVNSTAEIQGAANMVYVKQVIFNHHTINNEVLPNVFGVWSITSFSVTLNFGEGVESVDEVRKGIPIFSYNQ